MPRNTVFFIAVINNYIITRRFFRIHHAGYIILDIVFDLNYRTIRSSIERLTKRIIVGIILGIALITRSVFRLNNIQCITLCFMLVMIIFQNAMTSPEDIHLSFHRKLKLGLGQLVICIGMWFQWSNA
ncbi:hypothetical protein D3C74_405360 [compost metagenome]